MDNYFIYNGRLPSLNEYITQNRKHPKAGAEFKREWQFAVGWAIKQYKNKGLLKAITKPCKIHFHYYEADERRDYDNVTGFAHKILLDSLVEMGILPNDNRKWLVGGTDDFYKSKDNKIIVVIQELD